MGVCARAGSHERARQHPKSLIEAVVACVDDGAPPPPQLRLAWQCEEWNAQPEAGGMLDQDHALMVQMTAANNIYRTLKRFRGLVGKMIHSLSQEERRILKVLRDEEQI